jgi:uncharacterized PurR-regulated membrane protein YhhQ (DUF165 family)
MYADRGVGVMTLPGVSVTALEHHLRATWVPACDNSQRNTRMAAFAKAFTLWLVILVLAITNGSIRESVLIPHLGNFAGLVTSGIILSVAVFLVALLCVPWYGRLSATKWWWIGVFWLCLTLLFEFGFGRFVRHHTLQHMLEAYTFKDGNIWPLVLLTVLVSPWLAARLRGRQ